MKQSSLKFQPAKVVEILTIFGSTDIGEQTFSNMNFIENKPRRRLNDVSLDTCWKVKTTQVTSQMQMHFTQRFSAKNPSSLTDTFASLYAIQIMQFNYAIKIKLFEI